MPIWLIGPLVAALIAGGSSWWVTREVYTGKIAKIELAQAEALAKAVEEQRVRQAKVNEIDMAAAVGTAASAEKIIKQTLTIVKEIPIYVQDDSACITYGFVRVHDAAVYGVDPASLDLPAGKSDSTCAPFGAIAVSQAVAENYGTARENANQLDGLSARSIAVHAAVSAPP